MRTLHGMCEELEQNENEEIVTMFKVDTESLIYKFTSFHHREIKAEWAVKNFMSTLVVLKSLF